MTGKCQYSAKRPANHTGFPPRYRAGRTPEEQRARWRRTNRPNRLRYDRFPLIHFRLHAFQHEFMLVHLSSVCRLRVATHGMRLFHDALNTDLPRQDKVASATPLVLENIAAFLDIRSVS